MFNLVKSLSLPLSVEVNCAICDAWRNECGVYLCDVVEPCIYFM